MSSLAFDTHSLVKELTQAGMPEQQAEVLVNQQKQLLEEQLASKQDITEVKQDIAEVKQDIKVLDVKIESIKAELKRDITTSATTLKRDIKELESKLTIKLGGTLVVGISVIAMLIKLL